MSYLLKPVDKLTRDECDKIDVVCIGHFNVLHPGHFRFINFAANRGSTLCVILKDDDEFEPSERHHYFAAQDRADILYNVPNVKHIIIKGSKTLEQCLEVIRPTFFVLGHEFERQRPQEISILIDKADDLGIEVIFHSGDHARSFNNAVINEKFVPNRQDTANQDFMRVCQRRDINLEDIGQAVLKFSSINTLVIGDLIVDEFISTEPLGLSSEAPVVVVKEIEKKSFIGGAGVVASHVASLGANCHFLSVSGADEQRDFAMDTLMANNVNAEIFADNNRPTTFKTRFMADNQKLFRVSRLMDTDINTELENKLIDRIESLAPTLDNIIVSDFVYGVITDRLLQKLIEVSKAYNLLMFGDLQCSSQVGNILKFKDFDMIFPTEKESRIAINNKDDGIEFVAQTLFEKSQCDNLMIKLGGNGLTVYSKKEDDFIQSEHFPALSVNPIDVSGAGDSLLAAVSTSLTGKMNLLDATAFGCVVASCAVETMGNLATDLGEVRDRIHGLYQQYGAKL